MTPPTIPGRGSRGPNLRPRGGSGEMSTRLYRAIRETRSAVRSEFGGIPAAPSGRMYVYMYYRAVLFLDSKTITPQFPSESTVRA